MTDDADRPADAPDPAVPPMPPPARPEPPRRAPMPPSRPTTARPPWLRTSLTFKILAIGAIVVLLAIPLLLLRGLINEREQMRDTARRDVAAQWGQAQSIGGPVLTIPYVTAETIPASADGRPATTSAVTRYLHVFPDRLEGRGRLTTEVRTRGIFRVVLYNTGLDLTGAFPSMPDIETDAAALGVAADALRPEQAFLQIGITDMVGVQDTVRIRWNGTAREADPGIATRDVFDTGVSAPVGVARTDSAATFAVRLDLNGSRSLGLLPIGKETTLEMAGDWGTPRFAGAFLPDERSVRPDGFSASWRVLHLNRSYPQVFTGAFGRPTALDPDLGADANPWDGRSPTPDYVEAVGGERPSAFGVELLLPVDEYQKASRAAEYGMLFVLLTFLTFFLVEVLGDRRIHPVQYLLVGFAVTLFYLLLLAFAEYAPFNGAYAMAAVSILALVTLYARAVFGGWRLALLVGGLLTMFYGYFFVLLQLEAYALLAGSLGLLVTLAVVMYLSRRVDWYGDGQGERVGG